MLIGQLAQRTGFTRDTIRFYEKHGLIEVPRKARRENNYKEYPDEVLARLLTIKRVKAMGFTLNETQEILDLMDLDLATCADMTERVDAKVISIDTKINELMDLRKQLLDGLKTCPSVCAPTSAGNNCGLLTSC